MPVTAKDFKIYNSTPQFEQQLNQAFDYFRSKFPDADAGLRYMAENNIAIMNNPPGNPMVSKEYSGSDLYGHAGSEQLVMWDPSSGILVTNGGQVTGIESAADGLAHEIWGHAFNSANDAMGNIPDGQYDWANERVAVGIESALNLLFGEPLRDNHDGHLVWTSDVTVHTITGENGELILVRTDSSGHDIYGPQIDYTSPGWQKLQHAFDQASGANNGGGGSGGSAAGDVTITGHQTGEGDIVYDGNGNPFLFFGAPVVITYVPPETGPGSISDGDVGGGAWESGWSESGGSGGGEAACVACESFLPDGRQAGDVLPDDIMHLGDERTLEPSTGRVSYSKEKIVPGSRIVTDKGAALVCSDTAQIPVKERGLMTPDHLIGELVGIRRDQADGSTACEWEKVVGVEKVGMIRVQHITCENKCFWAGERKGAYFLHHNVKGVGGNDDGLGGIDWSWFTMQTKVDPVLSGGPATPNHDDPASAALVGAPHFGASMLI